MGYIEKNSGVEEKTRQSPKYLARPSFSEAKTTTKKLNGKHVYKTAQSVEKKCERVNRTGEAKPGKNDREN